MTPVEDSIASPGRDTRHSELQLHRSCLLPEAAGRLLSEKGVVPASLQADLDRLAELGIPVDVVFEQGVDVLFGG